MKHVVRVAAHWALLTHIYISMAGLTLAMLFGVTGLALNHQDFGLSDPRIDKSEVVLDKHLLAHSDQATLEQYVREKLGIRSPSESFGDIGRCRRNGRSNLIAEVSIGLDVCSFD